MSRDTGKMLAVATPGIDGVTLRRHILDREAAGVAKLAQRLGRRLRTWFQKSEEKQGEWPTLPDEDIRDNLDLYRKCITDLLREQRERAKLVSSAAQPQISDEEFEQQLAEIARRAILEMPKAELDGLIELRRAAPRRAKQASPMQGEKSTAQPSEEPSQAPDCVPTSPGDDGGKSPDFLSGFDNDDNDE